MSDIIIILGAVSIICTTLTVCGLLADYVAPRSHLLNKFIDSLPLAEHDENQTDDSFTS